MKFAVAYRDYYTWIQGDTNDFYYCEEESDPIYYLDAPNREAAAMKFLSKDYDDMIKRIKEFQYDDYFAYTMKEFIVHCNCGYNILEDILEECEKQKEVSKLTDDIYDYYIEKLMEAGKLKIMIKKGETSWDGNLYDEECIEKVLDKFPASSLLGLLTDSEKKKLFIETNLRNVVVIRLEKM